MKVWFIVQAHEKSALPEHISPSRSLVVNRHKSHNFPGAMSTGVMINEPVFSFHIAFCNVYWQFDPATKPVYLFIEVQQPAGKLAISSSAVSDVSISALPWESLFHGWVHTYRRPVVYSLQLRLSFRIVTFPTLLIITIFFHKIAVRSALSKRVCCMSAGCTPLL